VIRALLLDALGTLVRLEPPAPRLRAELKRRTGRDVGEDATQRAFAAEIAYYVDHHTEGRDAASLEDLRDRCAAVLGGELGLEGPAVRDAMLASLSFRAFPDAPPTLRDLRARGMRLVVASNWDCSLPAALESAGLLELVDGVASSAEAGAAKPHPAVLERALLLAGAGPAEAMHVGDSPETDLPAASAAGVRGVLLVRDEEPPPGVQALRSLAELPGLL
jgi:putative hydrolase of the HAD superfamily